MSKKKILQINTVSNSRSTGRIAEGIGYAIKNEGWESWMASGKRMSARSNSAHQYFIGSSLDYYLHALGSRFFDAQGFFSKSSTKKLISKIEEIQPDLIHLHNIHGYYLNMEILFRYLQQANIPVVWTLHDCWPYTGHCAYYTAINCKKWETHCESCPNIKSYPQSYIDRSFRNFNVKRELFTAVKRLSIVTPSNWLANEVKRSFLKNFPIHVINNGINLSAFKPAHHRSILEKYSLVGKRIILGVASVWDERKGLNDFLKLDPLLEGEQFQIVLVGLSAKQITELPKTIVGISRTEDIAELAALYSEASFFFNPTYEDNFPTTNIEALACGTPVITYDTGGSPEIVDEKTGFVVRKGDVGEVASLIKAFSNSKESSSELMRKRALQHFDQEHKFKEYINLYKTLLQE